MDRSTASTCFGSKAAGGRGVEFSGPISVSENGFIILQ